MAKNNWGVVEKIPYKWSYFSHFQPLLITGGPTLYGLICRAKKLTHSAMPPPPPLSLPKSAPAAPVGRPGERANENSPRKTHLHLENKHLRGKKTTIHFRCLDSLSFHPPNREDVMNLNWFDLKFTALWKAKVPSAPAGGSWSVEELEAFKEGFCTP